MTTTTIRFPAELKLRIAASAARAGTTAHNFILQALAEKTTQEELQSDLNALAEQRYANIIATGKTIAWSEMRSYLESHGTSARPVAKKLRR